jgi:hypothetical protein
MSFRHPAAVVVAHPGHEVRIHGWLERERPVVFVLTDGAGRVGRPRIASTAEYLERFGMRPGRLFGQLTDTEVYRRVLARDFQWFVRLSETLAAALVEAGVECVTGDASEGYNTTHDITRLLTNAAVELARRRGGREVANYDFPVVYRPDHCPAPKRAGAEWLHLDEDVFGRKLDAAFEFYPELAAETRDALRGLGDEHVVAHFNLGRDEHAATDLAGLDVFRVECLRPASPADPPFESAHPFYEAEGERKVEAGLYPSVIRYAEHIRPLADALRESLGLSVNSGRI